MEAPFMKGSSTVGHREPSARLWLEGCTWLRRGSGVFLLHWVCMQRARENWGQACWSIGGISRCVIDWWERWKSCDLLNGIFCSSSSYILYVCFPSLSLYISPFLVRFSCLYVPQFQEVYFLGRISSPQEFLFRGTWLLWWQAQRHRVRQVPACTTGMRAPWWNFGEAWSSLANIGHPAKSGAKVNRQKGDQKREKVTKWLRKGHRKRKESCGTSNWRTHKPYSQEFPWHSPEFRRRSLTFTRVPVKVPSVWGWPSECAQSNEARKALLSVQQHASWNDSS